MIPQSATGLQTPPTKNRKLDQNWQNLLQSSYRQIDGLLDALALKASAFPQLNIASDTRDFPLLVPRPFVELMKKGDPNDPLLKQVLPIAQEYAPQPSTFTHDPIQELSKSPMPGMIHKYHGRVLLLVSPHCAVNCRYCFRRHFPYSEHRINLTHMQQCVDKIRQLGNISEVILSGGDPLVVSDSRLCELVRMIESVPSVKRLRIHSRLPVVIPQRLHADCISWLDTRLNTSLVLHINHPNEISPLLQQHLAQVKQQKGVALFNQTLLLSGINDDADILVPLSEKLFEAGIIPYYIHLLDRVQGAAHFEVEAKKITQLQQQLWAQLPGYLLPRFVRDVPEQMGKVMI